MTRHQPPFKGTIVSQMHLAACIVVQEYAAHAPPSRSTPPMPRRPGVRRPWPAIQEHDIPSGARRPWLAIQEHATPWPAAHCRPDPWVPPPSRLPSSSRSTVGEC
ncbi:unnamed protein product [Cuscuta epithymum]|uniref:Uncharacterized protein n=1 Tax=Cuscuta epithymum TaxID=186058 RepID=A0AAV0DDV3_9ASTE|nr:unnamed protein product [Cuscuta epithymum]